MGECFREIPERTTQGSPTFFSLLIEATLKHPLDFNSLTTEKQMTKFSSATFQKMLSSSYSILRIQRLEGKQCRSI